MIKKIWSIYSIIYFCYFPFKIQYLSRAKHFIDVFSFLLLVSMMVTSPNLSLVIDQGYVRNVVAVWQSYVPSPTDNEITAMFFVKYYCRRQAFISLNRCKILQALAGLKINSTKGFKFQPNWRLMAQTFILNVILIVMAIMKL